LCNELSPELLQDLPAQGRDFIIAGIVGSMRRLATRDGRSFIAAQVQDLSGELEVTVWPDVYEMTTDLWLAGSIVLMKVRVRERGDRLTIGVQEVVGFEEEFIPPVWADPSTLGDVPPRRNGNGNGYGNGHTNGAPLARSVERLETPADAPTYDLPPPIEDEPSLASPPPEPVSAEPPARFEAEPAPPPLRLELTESPDEDADQKRLATVFRLLQAQPGNDRILLTIHTRDGDAIDLALPTAKLDADLRQKLGEAVGTPVTVT
jgi:hypothetical protein